MSNAIVTVIMAALLLAGVSILAQGSFTALSELSEAWKGLETRSGQSARTEILPLSTSYASPTVDVTLRNAGQEPLRDFDSWDVLVQYQDGTGVQRAAWLPFTSASPVSDNEWGVWGIYADAGKETAEAHQPNILDPGEELIIRVQLSPAADGTATNTIIIGTPNGVTLSTGF